MWWPEMSTDMVDYIAGCLQCATHGPAKTPSPSLPTNISGPFQLVGMDFVGPFPPTKRGNTFLLVLVDYFSRYVWAFPVKSSSASTVISTMDTWILASGTVPVVFYLDPCSAFTSEEFLNAARQRYILVVPAPARSYSSVGKFETMNRILQGVVAKSLADPGDWDLSVPLSLRAVNSRCIRSLGYSHFEILHSCRALKGLSSAYGGLVLSTLRVCIEAPGFSLLEGEAPGDAVVGHMVQSYVVSSSIRATDRVEMEARRARYDLRATPFSSGTLVMMATEGRPPKLSPKWTGPYFVD